MDSLHLVLFLIFRCVLNKQIKAHVIFMGNNKEILQLKLISIKKIFFLIETLNPQANVRTQDTVEILKGEAQKIPETNGGAKKEEKR